MPTSRDDVPIIPIVPKLVHVTAAPASIINADRQNINFVIVYCLKVIVHW